MASNPYGNFNPGGIDPFPIETSLATAAATSPAEAQLMLNAYHQQNMTSQGLYTQELDAQHQAARDQIASQNQIAQLKAFTDIAKDPASLRLAASSPEYSGVLGHPADAVLQDVIGQGTRLQDATIAEKGSTAGLNLTNLGAQPNADQLRGLTGVGGLNVGTPEAEKVANINAAARLGAAAIGASGTRLPSVQMVVPEGGGKPQFSITNPSKSGLDTKDKLVGWATNSGYLQPEVKPLPLPGQDAAPTTPAPAATKPPAGKTSLQSARPATGGGGGGTPVANATPNVASYQRVAQNYVESTLRTSRNPGDQQKYVDIKAAMAQNNGQVPFQVDPQTNRIIGIQGKSGRVYH